VTTHQAISLTTSGLANGALYGILLLGILLSYQVSRAVNFAQGQIGMLASFGSYWLIASHGFNPVVAVLVGLAAAMATSTGTEVLLLRRVPEGAGRDLLITLGVFLMLTVFAQDVFGSQSFRYLDLLNTRAYHWGGATVNWNDLAVITTFLVLAGAAYLILVRTSTGAALRAVAEAPALARTVGYNVERIRAITWAAAGLSAGIAAVLAASRLSVSAFYMTPFLIKAFIAGIAGGLDRLIAPLLVALAIGVFEIWAIYLMGAQTQDAAVFVLILVLLALLPRRLLAERREARA
jgi:branched-chain amino acid transport system permease protein